MERDRKDTEPKVIQPLSLWTQNIMKGHHNPQPV